MTYVGRGVDAISNVEKLDNITFSGTTTYNLTKSSVAFTPSGANNILISIDGVVQQGNFTVSGSTIIFDWSPASSNTCNWIQHYGTGVLNVPADGTITASKMADNSIDSDSYVDGSIDIAHIADDAITTDKLANSINTAITANTSKTTNATHSGEVTGATALTIADNIVDEANLKVSNAPTNGYSLTAQSGNTGGLTWASVGGTFVKVGDVQSNSAASSHDLTGIFSDTYDKYFFSLSTYPATAGKEVSMQFLDGSNNAVTSSYYGASYGRNHSGTSVSHSGASVSSVIMSNGMSGDRAFQCQGYIIGATSGITSNKQVQWYAGQWDASNNYEIQVGGYFHTSATDYTGMRILSNGVNITAISLQVYGIVDTKNYNG